MGAKGTTARLCEKELTYKDSKVAETLILSEVQ